MRSMLIGRDRDRRIPEYSVIFPYFENKPAACSMGPRRIRAFLYVGEFDQLPQMRESTRGKQRQFLAPRVMDVEKYNQQQTVCFQCISVALVLKDGDDDVMAYLICSHILVGKFRNLTVPSKV